MKNPILDEFAKNELARTLPSTALGQEISIFLASSYRVPMNQLDSVEDISISIHPQVANAVSKDALHSHDYFELIYMYQGSATQYFPNETLTITEGSVYLLNTNVKHGVYIDAPDAKMFNILIRSSLLTHTFLSLITDNDLLNSFFINSLFLENNNDQYIAFMPNTLSTTEQLLQAIIIEFIEKKPCFRASMKSYLLLLFTELLRNHIHRLNTKEKSHGNFSEILLYINNNLATVTLNDTAEHFHYSPSYLSKLFKQYSNRSFSDVVQELKLEQTSNYLRNTGISIDSIVELMGYYDRSYFNKVFKKKFGIGPSDYRSLSFRP